LSTDAGGWQAPITPGANATPYNSQCTLNGQSTTVSGSGNTLTLNASITFNSSFVGNLQAFVYASDSNGAAVGWQGLLASGYTAYSLPSPTATPTGSIAPSTGAGMSPTFTVTSQDLNGWKYILTQHALIGASSGNLANSCLVVPLNWAGGTLYLLDNDGVTWLGPAYASSPSTLRNYQCSVNSGSLTVSAPPGNTVTFTVGVTFSTAFTGLKNTYLAVSDQGGQSTPMEAQGTWVVGPSLGFLTASPVPAGNVGSSYSFAFSATGGIAPYSFQWASDPLYGLTLSAGGLLSGTPAYAYGSTTIAIQVQDALGDLAAETFSITINPQGQPPSATCTPSTNPAPAGQQISFTAAGSGGSGSGYTFTWSGVVSGTGPSIAFTPSVGGIYWEWVIVHDSANRSGSGQCSVEVQGSSGAAISAMPSSQTIGPASTASYTISVSSLAGFSGTVGFSASGLPAGATASFSPGSISSSGNAALTVTTASPSPTGTFPITIMAVGSSREFTTQAFLTVAQASPANMIAPVSGAILTGSTATFTWSAGMGVSQYQLLLGSTPGASDYYSGSAGGAQSASVTLPSGSPPKALYATLNSWIGGAVQARSYGYRVGTQPGAAPQGQARVGTQTYYVLNNGTPSPTWSFCLADSNGQCDDYFNAGLVTACTVSGQYVSAEPSFPSENYPSDQSAFDVVFTADAPASTGWRSMTCSWAGYSLTWSDAVYVEDATPVITYIQQYPPNADGSFYASLWGSNFGPAPGSISACLPGSNTCNASASVTVCVSAGCGALYAYWSDSQINALIIPGSQTWGSYDVFVTSGGESPGLGFQFAPAGLSTNISNRMQVYQVQTSPPTPRIYWNGQDITGTTQNVIVGQQIALNGMNVGGPSTNQYWTVNGTYVGGFNPSVSSDGLVQNVNLTQQNVTFYFTAAGTSLTVTYSLTAPNGLVFSAGTTFSVVAPYVPLGGTVQVTALDATAILVDMEPGYRALRYGPVGAQGGINFTNPPYLLATGYSGIFEWVQVVNSATITRTASAGGQQIEQCHGLDTTYPYSASNIARDSPNGPVQAAYTEYVLNENFTMWLMFQPTNAGQGAIYVPVANVQWGWSADITSADGINWTFVSKTPAQPSAQGTSDFPRWDQNVTTNCSYQ
jgi:hypothetical protein